MADSQPAVAVEDVSFRYAGADADAVRGIGFEVATGEIFGFLGPSGAGKSTTQRILIRLLDGYEGTVSVLGRDLSTWGDDFYERVGVSFELPANYRKMTGRENLEMFASLYAGDVEDPEVLLDMVGLGPAADQRVAQYSKGMQMRLNFARALLNKPELLFLDEPTGGLDPASARRIRDIILDKRSRGTTVFLTTHDMMVADELCDRVAFIVDGEIPVIEAPRELKLQHGERRVQVEYRDGGDRRSQTFSLEQVRDESIAALLPEGVEVETIHTEEATLEQVFLEVTGRGLT